MNSGTLHTPIVDLAYLHRHQKSCMPLQTYSMGCRMTAAAVQDEREMLEDIMQICWGNPLHPFVSEIA